MDIKEPIFVETNFIFIKINVLHWLTKDDM